jgi:hypothetical protein
MIFVIGLATTWVMTVHDRACLVFAWLRASLHMHAIIARREMPGRVLSLPDRSFMTSFGPDISLTCVIAVVAHRNAGVDCVLDPHA